jgi:hypothetical protein
VAWHLVTVGNKEEEEEEEEEDETGGINGARPQ